jgi:hypothetical protein
MAFKGTINTSGRPPGTPNKTTTEIREHFQTLISNNLDLLDNDLKDLKPIERLKMIIELSKFVIPVLKATDLALTGQKMGENFKPIIIKFVDQNDNETIRD